MNDIISREELVNILQLMLSTENMSYGKKVYGKAIQQVKSLPTVEAELQRAYDQGVKDTLDKYDETCRIASNISMVMGCKDGKECWELIGNGEIQRVKHGHWKPLGEYDRECSRCYGIVDVTNFRYCPNCGARMDEVER